VHTRVHPPDCAECWLCCKSETKHGMEEKAIFIHSIIKASARFSAKLPMSTASGGKSSCRQAGQAASAAEARERERESTRIPPASASKWAVAAAAAAGFTAELHLGTALFHLLLPPRTPQDRFSHYRIEVFAKNYTIKLEVWSRLRHSFQATKILYWEVGLLWTLENKAFYSSKITVILNEVQQTDNGQSLLFM